MQNYLVIILIIAFFLLLFSIVYEVAISAATIGIVVGSLLVLIFCAPAASPEIICNNNHVSYSFVSQISKATGDDPVAIAYALSFAAKNGLDIEEGLHWIDPDLTIDDVSVSIRKYGEN